MTNNMNVIALPGANMWMGDSISCYIKHHPRPRLKVCHLPSIHAGISFGCYVVSMDVIHLLGCLYNDVSTSPMLK